MRQQGFALPMLITLLVISSLVSAHAVRLSAQTHEHFTQSLQTTRAFYAAQAGLHWQMSYIDLNGGCPTLALLDGAELDVAGFSVGMECSATQHVDGGRTVNVYALRSEAYFGAYGETQYVSRLLEATYAK